MRRLRIAIIGAFAAILLVAAPVSAITYGQPDGGEHPYVGFMILYDASPGEAGWYSCSGTLLSSTVFLTAGHCTYGIATDLQNVGASGGHDVWVTFDETDVLAGFPKRADYTDVALLNSDRFDWLQNNSAFVRGVSNPNPLYDNFANFPVNNDTGIVVLDSPVPMGTYGVLAAQGTADEMAKVARTRNAALLETVGYGIQAIQPNPMEVDSRYKSTSRIVEVKGNASKGGNLHTLNNPSPIGGTGGSCFGDSGGPLFVNNTNQIVSVVSYGFSATCHGADYSWRVDTEPSYEFILPFLAD